MPSRSTPKNPSAASVDDRLAALLKTDPLLEPHAPVIARRMALVAAQQARIAGNDKSLAQFAAGHHYFGLHRTQDKWVLREWAPTADLIFMVGDRTGWQEQAAFGMHRVSANGVWELRLPLTALAHGDLYRLSVHWPGGQGDRTKATPSRACGAACRCPRTLCSARGYRRCHRGSPAPESAGHDSGGEHQYLIGCRQSHPCPLAHRSLRAYAGLRLGPDLYQGISVAAFFFGWAFSGLPK